MDYYIHVVDNISLHQKDESNNFTLTEGSLEGEPYQKVVADAFYSVSAENPTEAVTRLSSIIEVDNVDRSKLADALIETKRKISVSDFNSDSPDYLLTENYLQQTIDPYGNYFVVTCQIHRKEDEEQWIEVHRIEFYVIEQNKILEVS